jgi:hypothetical protein
MRRPDDPSALKYVIGVIYLPLREAVSWTTAHVEWLAREQRKHYQALRTFERLMDKAC